VLPGGEFVPQILHPFTTGARSPPVARSYSVIETLMLRGSFGGQGDFRCVSGRAMDGGGGGREHSLALGTIGRNLLDRSGGKYTSLERCVDLRCAGRGAICFKFRLLRVDVASPSIAEADSVL